LAAAIKRDHSIDSKLIEGSNGIFDVRVDGKLVYSKKETGRFPDDAEILVQIPS